MSYIFAFTFSLVAAVAAAAETCAWCENGDAQCDWTYSEFTSVNASCDYNIYLQYLYMLN